MKKLIALAIVMAACGGSTDTLPGQPTTGAPATTTQLTTTPPSTVPATTTPVTTTPATTTPVGTTDCPEVLEVEMTQTAEGTFTVAATVRSVDIADVSYADAWEVRDVAGNVLGIRVLTHPHANEQPFTRSLPNVPIPIEVTQVVVEARD
ncbi:MAG: hypothetical protein HKN91_09455, partial [Acidimicrobiia bacterium]|nr:hypothetical protein [Acidimicrobiia bacterium]